MFFLSSILMSLAVMASAQRPENASLCDYYAQTLLGANTASNQAKLMTLFLNTILVGNYTEPNSGVGLVGAASPGVYNGTAINLLPYFDTGLASTNDYVTPHGVAVNWLDDGGAAPVAEGLPSNGNTSSNQYKFFTHTYAYFGSFLGCSLQGGSELPFYQGEPSMYKVHQYMNLDKYQLGFFTDKVGQAATSLGFLASDVAFIKATLDTVFNHRCSPALTLVPASAGPLLQSICIADNCPLDPNATCSAYPDNGVASVPLVANASLVPNATISCHSSVKRSTDNGTEACSIVSSSAIASSTGAATASASGKTSGASSASDFGKQYLGPVAAVIGLALVSVMALW